MKELKFLHTADWHSDSDPVKQAKLKASLDQMVQYVKDNHIDAIIIAGDIWEKKQSYADNSGVPMVIEYLRILSAFVDYIFIVKGNNSHDEPGSISLLHQLEPNIYAYEYPVCLAVCKNNAIPSDVVDVLRTEDKRQYIDYIISLVPYPSKASIIAEDDLISIDNNNDNFLDRFENLFELIGDIASKYEYTPHVLAFHGNVVGSRLSTGQTLMSQDIMVAPSTLEKAKAHYYALGHIHLEQNIKDNMKYSGSIYNKNWGETEEKSFSVVSFHDANENGPEYIVVESVKLIAALPMIKIDATFENGSIMIGSIPYDGFIYEDAEYRIRIIVKENDKGLLTEEKLNGLKGFYNNPKIEIITIPNERESRSEEIMHCRNLIDEVKEYAAVINEPINETIEKKVANLQEVI